jgi:putative endonuclease
VGSKQAGDYGEAIASGYLSAKGYAIIARNYRRGPGEIDIIAEKGGTVVFAEVKARRGVSKGTPADAVTFSKRKKICAAALYWIGENEDRRDCRFDVIEVFGREIIDVRHIENAFDFVG